MGSMECENKPNQTKPNQTKPSQSINYRFKESLWQSDMDFAGTHSAFMKYDNPWEDCCK